MKSSVKNWIIGLVVVIMVLLCLVVIVRRKTVSSLIIEEAAPEEIVSGSLDTVEVPEVASTTIEKES